MNSADDLPKVLEFSVGGYMGDSFRVVLEDGGLLYEHLLHGYEPHKSEKVTPEPEDWERFDRALEVSDPWGWNGEYRLPPEQMVTDGSHWQVQLDWVGGRINASG